MTIIGKESKLSNVILKEWETGYPIQSACA